jgi:hypothetical protein
LQARTDGVAEALNDYVASSEERVSARNDLIVGFNSSVDERNGSGSVDIAASLQRGLDLERYAETSFSAALNERLGADAVVTGRQLTELSRSDAVDAAEMQQLLVQGDYLVFNALKAESNARIDAEVESHNRMVELANQLNQLNRLE